MRNYAVIIPTHERPGAPGFTVQAVDSVLGQTLPATEIIVVCDGPAGRAREALVDRPVHILEQPKGGVARARNAGIAASGSEWICFLDDDDLWHPEFLRTTDEFFSANKDVAAVNTSYWTFATDKEYRADLLARDLAGCLEATVDTEATARDTTYMEINGHSFGLLLERLRGAFITSTVRRDIVERVGGFALGFQYANDWLYFVNVARLVEWHYVPRRMAFVRQHASKTSRTQATNGVETLRAIHHMWAEQSLPMPAHPPLAAYGRDYRFRVQATLWAAIRNRRFDLAERALSLGMPLLPSWRDRVHAVTPPQLTWRLEHISSAIRSHAAR